MQEARQAIDERNHLRLWYAPVRVAGRPVFIGQISRDIGVRFTGKTWNLTTRKIDPDLNDSRESVWGGRQPQAPHGEMAQADDRDSTSRSRRVLNQRRGRLLAASQSHCPRRTARAGVRRSRARLTASPLAQPQGPLRTART